MDQNKIKVLDDREHVLLRPNMYLGSTNYVTYEGYVLERNSSFNYSEYQMVPALNKMFGEVIDNSIDEAIRTGFKYANKIDIKVTSDSVTVTDNGRGIPIEKEETTGEYGPVLAWSKLKAGANFENDDSGRETVGMNGLGVSLVNIFSRKFIGETQHKKMKLKMTSTDNMSDIKVKIDGSIEKPYTKVQFFPDFNRLEVDKIDNLHMRIMKQRIYILSIIYPKINFTFNDVTIKSKNNKDFLNMFGKDVEVLEGEDWFIGVYPNKSDDFKFFSYVNALDIKSGGNHINMISSDISSRLKEKLTKKYNSIKPGDVKNKLELVVIFKNFKNFETNSQTKDSLDNSVKYIKEYMGTYSDNIEKFVNKINKNKNIVDPIIEVYKVKEELKKKKELESIDKKVKKKIKSDKFTKSVKGNDYVLLVEGESALSGLMPVLGRENYSYYELKGKPLNSYDITPQKLISNKELNELREILGLSITGKNDDLNFKNVVFATDQDLDGFHIRGLLLAFFAKFGQSMINNLKVLQTPVAVAKRGDRIKEIFFSIDEINEYTPDDSGIKIHYKKGLGSWKKQELNYIFKNYNIDNFLLDFVLDDEALSYIDDWFSKDKSSFRKEHLKNNSFSIANL